MIVELKNYLNITWSDDDTDTKIQGILDRATAILNNYAATSIDYDVAVNHKQLLFDCCRYIYNDAYEDFKRNYKEELIMLRAEYSEVSDEETE
jgi:hypothetical protein